MTRPNSHSAARTVSTHTLHKGPVHVYLHKTSFPNAPKGEPEWFYSADDSNPARELSVST